MPRDNFLLVRTAVFGLGGALVLLPLPSGPAAAATPTPSVVHSQATLPEQIQGTLTLTYTHADRTGQDTMTVRWAGVLIGGNTGFHIAPQSETGFTTSGSGHFLSTDNSTAPPCTWETQDSFSDADVAQQQLTNRFSVSLDGNGSAPAGRSGLSMSLIYVLTSTLTRTCGSGCPLVWGPGSSASTMHINAFDPAEAAASGVGTYSISNGRLSVDFNTDQKYTIGPGPDQGGFLDRYQLQAHLEGTATAPRAHIEGYLQTNDDPQHPQTQNLPGPAPFRAFGGSQATTADSLKLICRFDRPSSTANAVKYTWTATGTGSSDFPPPAPSSTAESWQLGTTYLPARPADLQVTCAIDWSDGTRTTTDPQEVVIGVRTDEAVVIGWINPRGVPLATHGVGRDLLRVFPANHHWLTPALQGVAGTYLVRLATGSVTRPNGQGTLTEAERQYVLDWLFRYAANSSAPPSSFADSDALEAFIRTGTGYKLCNHAQIKYHLDQGGMVVDQVLHQETAIGVTNDPILGAPDPGSPGPVEGRLVSNPGTWQLTNEGSPDHRAVLAFNALVAPHGVFWNDIGSRITFSLDQGAGFTVDGQLYPTYAVYASGPSGLVLRTSLPQAAVPLQNFTNPAFPGTTSDESRLFRRQYHYTAP